MSTEELVMLFKKARSDAIAEITHQLNELPRDAVWDIILREASEKGEGPNRVVARILVNIVEKAILGQAEKV